VRIISGHLKGKRILAPSNLPVRPTTDFAKESLFNIISNSLAFENLSFLDLFAGTGNITYEMASRGCDKIICVDQDYNCCQFITKTINDLNFKNVQVIKSEARKFVSQCKTKFDLIFADPPFDYEFTNQLTEEIIQNNLLNPKGMLIIEHPSTVNLSSMNGFKEQRKYGRVNFSFFVVP
jgi:16S rRNA (guanine966-N2)-methyltransferase